MTTWPPRPKDLVKQYVRERHPDPDISHMLYDFAFWVEGQDLTDGPCSCRYHVLEGETTPHLCPFETDDECRPTETISIPIEAIEHLEVPDA